MRPSESSRRGSAGLILGMLLALAIPGLALAHAEIETSSPAADSTVDTRPASLDVTFTEAADPAKTSIEVRDGAGTVIATSQASDVSADGLSMSIPLPSLADGTYEVRWTTAALDGHIERGTYSFAVALAASPSPSAAPSASAAPPASAAQSASPAPTAAVSPSPAASPTEAPADGGGPTGDLGSLVLPLAAIVIVVVVLGAWFVRRRSA